MRGEAQDDGAPARVPRPRTKVRNGRFLECVLLVAVAGVGLVSGGHAEDAAAGKLSLNGNLHWNNGETAGGSLRGATDRVVTWDTEYFKEPLVLQHPFLRSIEFGESPRKSAETWRVRLRNGDVVCGEVSGIDDGVISLRSVRHGEIQLIRDSVIAADRIRDGGDHGRRFIYGGPFESEWGQTGETRNKPTWRAERGGRLLIPYWNRSIHLPLKFPERVELEIALRSTSRPQFTLGLDKDAAERVTVETWDDELVLAQDSTFVPLMTLGRDDRTVALRICWSAKTGTVSVFDLDGRLLGRKERAVRQSSLGLDGLVVANHGSDLAVETLRIREWNERAPDPAVQVGQGVELADGRSIRGRITRAEGGTLSIEVADRGRSETVVLAAVDRLVFGGEMSAAADQDKPPVELWFADGAIVSGRLLSIEKGTALVRTSWSAQPVASGWGELRSVKFNAPTEGPGKGEPLESYDRIIISKTTFHGRFAPGGDDKLRWLPVGGSQPVEVTVWPHMEIVRAASGEPRPRQPALFFTRNGEIIAGSMNSMAEMILNVRPSFAGETPLPVAGINAAQFNGREVDPEGFDDGGWRILKGGEKAVVLGDDRVTLNPGGGFGHLSILQGDEVQFRIQPVNGYGTLRVRLFAGDAAASGSDLPLLLMHYGSQVSVGLDRADRQNFGRQDVTRRVPANIPARITLALRQAAVDVIINEVKAWTYPLDPGRASGSGLIFETAAPNGNTELPMTVSSFRMRTSPAVLWSPPVDPVAKQNALVIPRFRRGAPPQHVLIASNGDLLRGTVEVATATHIRIVSGLETIEVPRDRVAAMVWLKPPAQGRGEKLDAPAAADPWKVDSKAPWFSLRDGSRLRLSVERMEKDRIIGTCSMFGRCELPLDLVAAIHVSPPPPSRAMLNYQNWNLRFATEPVLPDGGGDKSPLVGTDPGDFSLPLLDGSQFTLSKHKNRVVVLDFWASWCGPCVAALPELIEAMKPFSADSALLIGVNQAESPAVVKRFLEQRHWSLTTALDAEQKIGARFGVEGIPHTVVIAPDGKIAHVTTGYQRGGGQKIAEVVRKLMK